jgi:hypothetical protein
MGHFEALKEVVVRCHEGVEAGEVTVADRRRADDAPRAALQVLEHLGLGERELNLVAVEDLKDQDFVSVEAELLEAKGDIFGRFEEVGEEEDDAATVDEANGVLDEERQAGTAGGLQLLELAEHEAELVGSLGRPDEFRDVGWRIESDHAGGVILSEEEPGEGGGEGFSTLEFGSPGGVAAVKHGGAGVADDVKADIGLLHVAFDAEAIASGIEAPIEMAQVVAGLVVAIVAELDAKAMEGAVMHAAEETLHHITGLEVEAFEGREELRIEPIGQ